MGEKLHRILEERQRSFISGDAIEEARGAGYRLKDTPDLLSEVDLRARLRPGHPWADVVCLDVTDSTNRVAMEMAENGAPHGTVVVAGRTSRTVKVPPKATSQSHGCVESLRDSRRNTKRKMTSPSETIQSREVHFPVWTKFFQKPRQTIAKYVAGRTLDKTENSSIRILCDGPCPSGGCQYLFNSVVWSFPFVFQIIYVVSVWRSVKFGVFFCMFRLISTYLKCLIE